MKLPDVPQSFDESIIYNNAILMYMQLPMQLIGMGNKNEEFWKQLNQRNKCSSKQASKMICVLFSLMEKRTHLLKYINDKQMVWGNTKLSKSVKLLDVMNQKDVPTDIKVQLMDIVDFNNLEPVNLMEKVFLISANISLLIKPTFH